ncbi:MAG: tetratricopeptide repeat protein [Taibaiella sp.]|nr:tetratricopeptide repeat protein [Taibaiella sp.]
MKVIKIVVVFIFLLGLIVQDTSGQIDSVFTVPYPERYLAVNKFISAGRDSANDAKTTRLLLKEARENNEPCDILNIERAILIIDHMWRVDTANLTKRAEKLIREAEMAGCHPVVAFVFETLGDYYYENHNYVRAFEYYLKSYDYYHNLYSGEFPDMSESQLALAGAYYTFNDYNKSLRYSKEIALNGTKKAPWTDILIHDMVGTSYLKLHQFDSAVLYFQKTFALAPTYHSIRGATAWKGVARGKIGLVYFEQGKYQEAVPYLKDGVALCSEGNDPVNVAPFAVSLFNIYLSQGDVAEAKQYLLMAQQATYNSKKLQNYHKLYMALSSYYRSVGNFVLTLSYIDSTIIYKDSIDAIIDVNKKNMAELRVSDERQAMLKRIADDEKQRQILIRNELIIIAVMLMLFILLFYNRKLLMQKYQRQQLIAEKNIAETELSNAIKQFSSLKKNIAEKNELIISLEKVVSGNSDSDLIAKLQQSTILTEDQWDEFRRHFEKVHPGFLNKLKEKLPELSPAETRFMVLAKLNFNNKEMAAILGVSNQAIRTTWYRLRKKLSLPEEGTIEELVERI